MRKASFTTLPGKVGILDIEHTGGEFEALGFLNSLEQFAVRLSIRL